MSVALEVVQVAELLGAMLSGPDLETLVAGAVEEENPEVAVGITEWYCSGALGAQLNCTHRHAFHVVRTLISLMCACTQPAAPWGVSVQLGCAMRVHESYWLHMPKPTACPQC